MDVDDDKVHNQSHISNTEHTNAVAGPSTIALPSLFLPPPGPPQPSSHLTSTQDLLARFQLLSAYDQYVRPFYADAASQPPAIDGQDHPPTPSAKGKEREHDSAQADALDADDDEKGEKKKKNSYRHLIKGIPGKHSMKKDKEPYLTTMMQVPPKQRMPITQFDVKTQREAFAVSLEGLKGWNINTLVLESAQAREDRKKRKELKRLAKAQGQGLAASPASTSAPFNAPTPNANPHSHPHPLPIRTGTPKLRPTINTSTTTLPSTVPASARTPTTAARTPTTATPTSSHPQSQPPPDPGKRGKKREHEEGGQAQGQGQVRPTQEPPKAVLGARAGVAGVWPRPLKKQRMDAQGQARDVPVQQQPTPHA